MLDEALLSELKKHGIDPTAHSNAWSEASELLDAFDALVRAGGSYALVKVDGERTNQQVYTVVVDGGRLGEKIFRTDSADLRAMLREALAFYLENAAGD